MRGITIQGIGFGGGTGLRFNSGFALTMTNCVVRNHTGNGILLQPNASSNFSVSSTLVADNGSEGILLSPNGSGTVKAVFNRFRFAHPCATGDARGELMSGRPRRPHAKPS